MYNAAQWCVAHRELAMRARETGELLYQLAHAVESLGTAPTAGVPAPGLRLMELQALGESGGQEEQAELERLNSMLDGILQQFGPDPVAGPVALAVGAFAAELAASAAVIPQIRTERPPEF